jgi:hypothetical protein
MLCLNAAKKTLLAATAIIAITGPVLIGLAASRAAAQEEAAPSAQLMQERLAEQRQPRTQVAFAPAQFDKFAGYYRITATDVYVMSRKGNRYYAGVIGQRPDEIYPESDSKFFLKGFTPPAQFSFTTDATGRVTEMVLHQSGEEQHAPRIADADGKAVAAALAKRVASNRPSPGTEEAVLHQIEGLMHGKPDYTTMAPTLAAGTRQMLGDLHAKVAAWGPVTSVKFKGVSKSGMDVYKVTCRNKRSTWDVAPLTPDGKISSIAFEES